MNKTNMKGQGAMQVATGQQPRSCRGQSAMEFLMTYGWAVLIMLAVIGILFYLGVFNPKTIAPNACAMPAGFSCNGYQIVAGSPNVFTLDLVQTTGHTLLIESISCSDEDTPTNVSVDEPAYSGEKLRITATCYTSSGSNELADGDYFKGTIYLVYMDEDTNIRHQIMGEIAYKVEAATLP